MEKLDSIQGLVLGGIDEVASKALVPGRSILGALADAVSTNVELANLEKKMVRHAALSLGGLFAGYFIGEKYQHPVLGVLGGLAVGGGAAHALEGNHEHAVREVATTAVAIAGAFAWRNHPALGFLGAGALASVAATKITGKSAADEYAMLFARPALPKPKAPAALPPKTTQAQEG